jgi:ATP synthase protein I
MNDRRKSMPSDQETRFDSAVSKKIARKLRLQREGKPIIWSGFGMFGLVGWSVAVPTIVGAMLGMWWDHHYPGAHSWTLALLVAGLVIGCANAWYWIAQEDKAMHDHTEDDDE